MNIIAILVRLLRRAYREEAAKHERSAGKLLAESHAAGEEAIELAAKSQQTLDEAQELRAEATSNFKHADRLRKRGDEVAKFFEVEGV